MNWLLNNWKSLLIGVFLLAMVWAFAPSCSTRKGAEAERQAQQSIQSAKLHEGRANELEAAALKEEPVKAALTAERNALEKDKAALTAQVDKLRAGLPPHPVVGQGTGVHGAGVDSGGVSLPGSDGSLVQRLYEVVDAQAALIAKHVEDDQKEAEFIASLERSEAAWKASSAEWKARGDDLERALRSKEIQVDALQSSVRSAEWKGGVKGVVIGALIAFVVKR